MSVLEFLDVIVVATLEAFACVKVFFFVLLSFKIAVVKEFFFGLLEVVVLLSADLIFVVDFKAELVDRILLVEGEFFCVNTRDLKVDTEEFLVLLAT